jgi:hypothetical protein
MPLHEWETFYMIIGSAAAALTGLQFVVIALGAQAGRVVNDTGAVHAFATPNIVHFCAVLTISALIVMPGETALLLEGFFTAIGVAGVVYAFTIASRARRQTGYVPVFEDWLWHVGLPAVAYGALFFTGVATYRHTAGALYCVAGIALLLLFIGIHNAWDSAVYMSTRRDGDAE